MTQLGHYSQICSSSTQKRCHRVRHPLFTTSDTLGFNFHYSPGLKLPTWCWLWSPLCRVNFMAPAMNILLMVWDFHVEDITGPNPVPWSNLWLLGQSFMGNRWLEQVNKILPRSTWKIINVTINQVNKVVISKRN